MEVLFILTLKVSSLLPYLKAVAIYIPTSNILQSLLPIFWYYHTFSFLSFRNVKTVFHCCFGLHFPSYQACQAFSNSNCNFYVLIHELSVYILYSFTHIYIYFVSEILFIIYSSMCDGSEGCGRPKSSLAQIIKALPQTSFSLRCRDFGSIPMSS